MGSAQGAASLPRLFSTSTKGCRDLPFPASCSPQAGGCIYSRAGRSPGTITGSWGQPPEHSFPPQAQNKSICSGSSGGTADGLSRGRGSAGSGYPRPVPACAHGLMVWGEGRAWAAAEVPLGAGVGGAGGTQEQWGHRHLGCCWASVRWAGRAAGNPSQQEEEVPQP